MKFSYQDLAGNNIEVECESYIHIPSGAAVKSTEAGNYHITENFSFYKKLKLILCPSIDLLLIVILMFLIAMNCQH